MGCEYCKYSNYGESECSASKKYRDNFCGVEFENERVSKRNSNYTPPKKEKKKKMKPFICEHTCEYCVVEGCEERRNLPIGTRTSNFPIQDCDNVNVIVKGNGIPVIGVNKIFIGNQVIDRTI